jgi:Ca2+-binding EF-hand superfamily protein
MQSWSLDNDTAGLRVEELEELESMSLFSRQQLQTLYRRFKTLDRAGNGVLTEEDLMRVPEVALNPMVIKVMALFGFNKNKSTSTTTSSSSSPGSSNNNNNNNNPMDKTTIHFVDFVRAMSMFNGQRSEEEVLETCFDAFADHETRFITREKFVELIRAMVGDKGMTKDEIDRLVSYAMDEELQLDNPNGITFEQYIRILKGNSQVDIALEHRHGNSNVNNLNKLLGRGGGSKSS